MLLTVAIYLPDCQPLNQLLSGQAINPAGLGSGAPAGLLPGPWSADAICCQLLPIAATLHYKLKM